jgi:hypothetical protein
MMQRKHRQLWLIWFLAVICCVPVMQSSVEIAGGREPGFLPFFTHAPTRESLRAFEKALESESVIARAVRPWIQYGWFRVFGDPGEKALAGRDGWLFYRPDVQYLVESGSESKPPEDPLAAVLLFRDQLAERGIHLMVVPMPGKPSVYGGMLTRRMEAMPARSPTREFLMGLRSHGIETVDLFEVFERLEPRPEQPYYLRRDTHWSAEAAEIAAGSVASRLKELGWAQNGSVPYGVRTLRVRRPSDIARMTRNPRIEASFPPEEVTARQVFHDSTGAVYRDDPAGRVLVLGDSFLRIYEGDEPHGAGFIAHLARKLRQPVTSIVNDGGASTLVRQELARRPQLLRGKRVVIWEFVERDLRFGTEGWKLTPLPTETSIPLLFRSP